MVRLAEKEELGRVNEIRKQVSEVHYKGRPDKFRKDFCDELMKWIYTAWDNENSDILVAVRDDEICGFASVEYVHRPLSPYSLPRKFYHIAEFGVDEKYRRQKVATELFSFIRTHAKENGFDKIELDVLEFNEAAIKFYETVGFRTYRRDMEFDNL